MMCGSPATVHENRDFFWHPPWIFVLVLVAILPFVIVSLVLTEKLRVAVPLCAKHVHHWTWHRMVIGIGFCLIFVPPVIGVIMAIIPENWVNVDIMPSQDLGNL